jgi:hypothetical protein
MDYAKFAIITFIIATTIIAIIGKKSVFRQLGYPQNKVVSAIWRAHLAISMFLGAAISIGLTFLIQSVHP